MSGSERPKRLERIGAELAREPFRVPRWLRDPHLQTAWGPLLRRPRLPSFVLQVVATPDGDFLRLHRLAPREPGAKATVLLLHGLEGSVRSHYVAGLAERLQQGGFGVVAMEHRSCGGGLNRARRLYHSGETSDLAFVAGLLESEVQAPIYVVGVSLGGNVLAKWLGEEAERARDVVAGAVVISAPFDLSVSGPTIDRALGGLYVRRFLRTLVPKAVAKERQYPGCLDAERVARSRTFREFDTFATAALHGFRDAEDYWRRVGCGQFLTRIQVPTLLISAADDPFNPGSTLPGEALALNGRLLALFPVRGGHVGFVEGWPWRTRYWAEARAAQFLGLLHGAIAARL